MHCPRLDHFAKLHPPLLWSNKPKVVMGCCVMTGAPSFGSYDEMMRSQWLEEIRRSFAEDKFPKECVRCKEFEDLNLESSRLHYVTEQDRTVKDFGENYLTVSLMLDNICNAACQFCTPEISTKIASLTSNNYQIRDATPYYSNLPIDRITQIDLEGGEPSNSKNVKKLLKDLPPNLKSIRINTNCLSFMEELIPIAEQGISILITISTDGVEEVQEYMRWPTKWPKFLSTLRQYEAFAQAYPKLVNINLHTTLTALNVYDLDNIIEFAKTNNLAHSIAQIAEPAVLKISEINSFTLSAKEKFSKSNNQYLIKLAEGIATGRENQVLLNNFIKSQDSLRKINIQHYIKYADN